MPSQCNKEWNIVEPSDFRVKRSTAINCLARMTAPLANCSTSLSCGRRKRSNLDLAVWNLTCSWILYVRAGRHPGDFHRSWTISWGARTQARALDTGLTSCAGLIQARNCPTAVHKQRCLHLKSNKQVELMNVTLNPRTVGYHEGLIAFLA